MLMGMSHHTKSVFMCFCETLYEPSYEMCAYVFAKHQHAGWHDTNVCQADDSKLEWTVILNWTCEVQRCCHANDKGYTGTHVYQTWCVYITNRVPTRGRGTERAIVLCRLAKPKQKVLPGPVTSLPPNSEASLVFGYQPKINTARYLIVCDTICDYMSLDPKAFWLTRWSNITFMANSLAWELRLAKTVLHGKYDE